MFLIIQKFLDCLVHVHYFSVFESNDERVWEFIQYLLAQPVDLVVVGGGTIGIADELAVFNAFTSFQPLEPLIVESQLVGAGENLHLEYWGVDRFSCVLSRRFLGRSGIALFLLAFLIGLFLLSVSIFLIVCVLLRVCILLLIAPFGLFVLYCRFLLVGLDVLPGLTVL